MSKSKIFILNDETVKNSFGFYLMNAGARLERFNNNPVMLYSHDNRNVLGKWEGVKIEGTKMLATPLFDVDDPDALKIKGKVDRGFIKGVSLGIVIHKAESIKLADDYVLAATEWTAMEASVVSVPSN
ncbi:MAG: HK97 family phage prohead protease, partial [Bacteroidales bacterium]